MRQPAAALSGLQIQRRLQPLVTPMAAVDWSLVRVALGITACAVAAVAAWRGTVAAGDRRIQDAEVFFVATAVLGFIGLFILEPDESVTRDWRWSAPHSIRIGLIAAGVALAGVAAALLHEKYELWLVMSLWLVAMIAVAAGSALYASGGLTARQLELALLVVVGVAAVLLRVPDLVNVPVAVHGDEAEIGNQARRILSGQDPVVFGLEWARFPGLGFAIHAATLAIFGDNLFGLRMGSVIEGVLSILLLYLLVRRLWGPRPALLAAAFLAAAAWHIHYSRAGFHYMQGPLFMLLSAYLLVRGLQDGRLIDFVLCGFAIGASLEVYLSARLGLVVLFVYVFFRALTERNFLRTNLRGLAALVLAVGVFVGPLAILWNQSPDAFATRSDVYVWNPATLEHSQSSLRVDGLWAVIGAQALRTLEAFNIRGGTGLQYAHPWPMLDPWTGGLLAMGALALVVRLRSSRDVLLAAWVWLGLILGSVLTVDALFTPHALVVLPALVIVAALVVDRLWSAAARFGPWGNAAAALGTIAVVGLAVYSNADDYFRAYRAANPPSAIALLTTYVNDVDDRYRLFVFPRGGFNLTSEIPRFVTRDADALEVQNAQLHLPLPAIPNRKGAAFVVQGSEAEADQQLAPIKAVYPQGVTDVITRPDGQPAFVSYRVERAALADASSTSPPD